MSDNFDLDLTTWLDAVSPSSAPEDLLPGALARTARTRQRPRWLVAERWTTMQLTLARTRVSRRALALFIVALVALAIVAGLLAGGASRPPRLAIAFTVTNGGQTQVGAMAADGSHATALTDGLVSAAAWWTPDGSRLLIRINRNGNDDIYAMDPDGSHQVRLTQDLYNDGAAVMSPDGKSIAYDADTTDSGCYELFVMNADGTRPTQLTPDGDCNWGPSWTHDGRGLFFGSTRDGNFDIYTMRTDVTNLKRLTSNAATNDAFPRLSPDGTKVAFTSWNAALDKQSAEIDVMNVDGTRRTRLTTNGFEDSYPAWSPDGKKLVFQSNRDGNFEIYTMNVDGTGVTRLTRTPTDETGPVWR